MLCLLYCPALTSVHDYWKDHSLDYTDQTFVGKVSVFGFNILSRFVIASLPRNNRLLISWLQLPSAVILEPPKLSLSLCPLFSERSRDPEKNGIWNFQFLFPTKIQKVAAVIVVYLLSHVQLFCDAMDYSSGLL